MTRGVRGSSPYKVELQKVKMKDETLQIYVEKSDPHISSAMVDFSYKLYVLDKKHISGVEKVEFIDILVGEEEIE